MKMNSMFTFMLGQSKNDSDDTYTTSIGGKNAPFVALGLTATIVACAVLYQNQLHNKKSLVDLDTSRSASKPSLSRSSSSSSSSESTQNTKLDGNLGHVVSSSSNATTSATPTGSPYMGTRIPSFSRLSTVHEQQSTKEEVGASAGVGDNHTWTALGLEQPLVIAMVGLPARGKSYLVKMIIRYLKWTGFECQVFNVGSYRRQVGLASADSNFFDNSNPNNHKIREQLAMMVQDSMYKWLHETNEEKRRVAVFDATNTTKERRLALAQRAESENVFLLFVESICDDQEVLMKNYELKLQNDDYKGMDQDTARRDFVSRVKQYERVYETITDDENNGNIAYIKLINVGQKVITRNCHGYLPSQVAFYLQNVHINPRKIYLSVICKTSEESENVSGKESGELTEDAKAYVNALADFMIYEQEFDLVEKGKEILVLTGTAGIHERSLTGLKQRQFRVYHTPILNELRGGDLHGLSKARMKAIYPVEYEKRMADKLNYRYPGVGGESYLDVIERVRPVIIELERQRRSIVLVCHIAVLRCIYAYFMGVPLPEIPFKNFKYHHIYELEPGPFGCTCTIIQPHLHAGLSPVPVPVPLPITPSISAPPLITAPTVMTHAGKTRPLAHIASRTPTPRLSVILETQYHSMDPVERNTTAPATTPATITTNSLPQYVPPTPVRTKPSSAMSSPSPVPSSPPLLSNAGSVSFGAMPPPLATVLALENVPSQPNAVPLGLCQEMGTAQADCSSNSSPNPLGIEIERVTNTFDVPRGHLGSYDGNITPHSEAQRMEAAKQLHQCTNEAYPANLDITLDDAESISEHTSSRESSRMANPLALAEVTSS